MISCYDVSFYFLYYQERSTGKHGQLLYAFKPSDSDIIEPKPFQNPLLIFFNFQQKYFDSGDYQMAKQKGGGVKQVFANKVPTGDAIPTPESVPQRKTSIIQPCNKFTTS